MLKFQKPAFSEQTTGAPKSPVSPWDHEWREDKIRITTEEIAVMTEALETKKDLDEEETGILHANLKTSIDYINALMPHHCYDQNHEPRPLRRSNTKKAKDIRITAI